MHDPDVVAFTIVRPWPQRSGLPAPQNGRRWAVRLHHDHHEPYCSEHRCAANPFPWWKLRSYARFWRLAGRDFYWPPLVTVWHREPGGRDALTECQRRFRDKDGQWHLSRGWRWHIAHWHIQVHPAQALRRRLLTRCAWCGGRSRKGGYVNISHQWDGPRGRWWRGEPGLFHQDCSSAERAHRTCMCPEALFQRPDSGYGDCLLCGRFRPWRYEPDEADRLLVSLPEGSRIPASMRPQLDAAWAARRAQKAQADRES
jgi:hypothetical protein